MTPDVDAAGTTGQDQHDEAARETAPTLVTINLGGQTIQLPAEQAETVRRAYDALGGRLGAELQKRDEMLDHAARLLNESGRTAERAPAAPATDPGYRLPEPDLLLSKTDAWQRGLEESLTQRDARLRAEQEERITGVVEALRKESWETQQAALREARHHGVHEQAKAKFYADRPHLRENWRYVETVRDEIMDDIKSLPLSQAYSKLGEEVDRRLNAMTTKRGGGGASVPKLVSSGRRPTPTVTPDAPARRTMSDIIKAKQERMLQAASGSGK